MREGLVRALSVLLAAFVVVEVNYPHVDPQAQLAVFTLLGLCVIFLTVPAHGRLRGTPAGTGLDVLGVVATLAACGWVAVQSDRLFQSFWVDGQSLGNRAGAESRLDVWIGILGVVVLLEATRRSLGLALPILAGVFLLYGLQGPRLPDWLFPHRGYDLERLVTQSFLHSQGVFGIALDVMFTYVFLFVLFGALLEATGATAFIIDAARRVFRGGAGAPAKVSILSSGLMGSLSGSAVANTATTGTFTIPLMKSAGFRSHNAAAIEAAASSGGALVPPVMGAGAYMMLEIVDPPVTYLEIVRAAVIPAFLYYLALFWTVDLQGRRVEDEGRARPTGLDTGKDGKRAPEDGGPPATPEAPHPWSGVLFVAGLGVLLASLLFGSTVFRAVTWSMLVVWLGGLALPRTRLGLRQLVDVCTKAARGGVALVAAAASVGIVLGVVTLTGVGSRLPATIVPLAQDDLFLALALLMVSSVVLGMGLPSAVCYLLLATLVGPALTRLGVVPLAAHLFIFYFGLMSMVTPPVALAGYTAASIAGSPILKTSFAAFRFSLIGFVLPFLFVYRPELLMLGPDGSLAGIGSIAATTLITAAALLPLAAALTGYWRAPLGLPWRLLLGGAFLLAVWPAVPRVVNVVGLVVAAAALVARRRPSNERTSMR